MQLTNTAAEVDILFTKDYASINLVPNHEARRLPKVTLYAPTAQAFGRWRAGPEIGGAGENGSWNDLGWGFGYGIHVVHTEQPNKQMKKWVRFSGLPENSEAAPILHIFETPNGKQTRSLILLQEATQPIIFEEITFKPTTPKSWYVSGRYADGTIEGEITISETLETFNLKRPAECARKIGSRLHGRCSPHEIPGKLYVYPSNSRRRATFNRQSPDGRYSVWRRAEKKATSPQIIR